MKSAFRTLKIFCAAALTCLTATSVFAQSLPSLGQSETDWRYALGIYAFAPASTTGTSTVGERSVPINLDLGDILDLLDFAASGRFEA